MVLTFLVWSCGCDLVLGRLTVMPTSFTNTAVMMKKISRFRTKSSIGARSMPVSLSSWCCRWALRRMSVGELVSQQFGLDLRLLAEVERRVDARDGYREAAHGAHHRLRH